jgi:hypothetical protein
MVDLEPCYDLIQQISNKIDQSNANIDLKQLFAVASTQGEKNKLPLWQQQPNPIPRPPLSRTKLKKKVPTINTKKKVHPPPPPPPLNRRHIDMEFDPAHNTLKKLLPLVLSLTSRKNIMLQISLQTCGGILAIRDSTKTNESLRVATMASIISSLVTEFEFDLFVEESIMKSVKLWDNVIFQQSVKSYIEKKKSSLATTTRITTSELFAIILVSSIVSEANLQNAQQTLAQLTTSSFATFLTQSLVQYETKMLSVLFQHTIKQCRMVWKESSRTISWRELTIRIFTLAWENIISRSFLQQSTQNIPTTIPANNDINDDTILFKLLFTFAIFSSAYNMERQSNMGNDRIISTVSIVGNLIFPTLGKNRVVMEGCLVCMRAMDQLWERFRSCTTLRVPNSWFNIPLPSETDHNHQDMFQAIQIIAAQDMDSPMEKKLILTLRCRAALAVLQLLYPTEKTGSDLSSTVPPPLQIIMSNIPKAIEMVHRRTSLKMVNPSIVETVLVCDEILRQQAQQQQPRNQQQQQQHLNYPRQSFNTSNNEFIQSPTIPPPSSSSLSTNQRTSTSMYQDWTTSSSSWQSSLDSDNEAQLERLTTMSNVLRNQQSHQQGLSRDIVEQISQDLHVPDFELGDHWELQLQQQQQDDNDEDNEDDNDDDEDDDNDDD